jgi:hypothetical protein
MFGLAEAVVHDLQLTVLIRRRKCTTAEKGILMLQLLKLVQNGSVALILCNQTHKLMHDGSRGVMPQVEQVLDTTSRRCFHTGFSIFRIRKSVMGITAVETRQLSYREVSATSAVCSMVVSSSMLMMVPVHGSAGLRGIITLVSHMSRLSP